MAIAPFNIMLAVLLLLPNVRPVTLEEKASPVAGNVNALMKLVLLG